MYWKSYESLEANPNSLQLVKQKCWFLPADESLLESADYSREYLNFLQVASNQELSRSLKSNQ